MALEIGTQLGPYEITASIGAGGMGQVYRATDTKLKRDVAIKVLPDEFARDRERLARFEREAHVLASLNHSHIASIYGLEESDGVPCLVLELVEGQTLAELLAEKALPVDRALDLARQIASALEAAHEKGVVHRDLKPANIKVTPDGTVKVLDFGLAKALANEPADNSGDASLSPTLTAAATRAGTILGTASYMSPEQARGKRVDKRTDIWAFGCVLYEMLTGRQAYPGETASDAIARILEREPEWPELPAGMPLKIRDLLQRCLRRAHRDRLHDIADARIEIDEVLADPVGAATIASVPALQGAAQQARWRLILPWAVATVLGLLLGLMALLWPTSQDAAEWFAILPPNSTSGISPEPTVSPDGSSVVFRAMNDAGATTLWVRSFGSSSARELPGTQDARLPFWSPDSRSVAFFNQIRGELKRVDVAQGTAEVLARAPNTRGGAWSADGRILFAPTFESGFYMVPASGGKVTQVTAPQPGAKYQAWPHFLPDGKRFLFLGGKSARSPGLFVGSLNSGEIRHIADFRSRVEYVDGYLLFGDADTLLARRFDPEELEFLGEPARLAGGVGNRFGDEWNYAFSATGNVLVTMSGGNYPETQLVSVDRQGRGLGTYDIGGEIFGLSLSPDGTQIAFERWDSNTSTTNVWLADLATGVPQRFTSGTAVGSPVWSPDGSRLLTTSWAESYAIRGVVDGQVEQLAHGRGAGGWPAEWSSDGEYLLIYDNDPDTGYDIWILPLTGERQATPFIQSQFREFQPDLSGDSRWIAYVSDESGRFEVYVQSFPEAGRKLRVSVDGGTLPMWRENGRELYYVGEDGAFMAVTITPRASGLKVSSPQVLFQAPRLIFEGRRQYVVLEDGERFLFNAISGRSTRSITVLRNWQSLLEER